jgi:hypothetical protein
MSINLSPTSFSGGTFELRERESKRLVYRHGNTGCGDALIFRLSLDLEHRVTDVIGNAAKTAFAGWFRSQPHDYRALFSRPTDQ